MLTAHRQSPSAVLCNPHKLRAFVPAKYPAIRSMSDARDCAGNLLPDEKRLGKFGRALRATSLDELPELINILKGDMSVVGPRPLRVEYLPRYSKVHKVHRPFYVTLINSALLSLQSILQYFSFTFLIPNLPRTTQFFLFLPHLTPRPRRKSRSG